MTERPEGTTAPDSPDRAIENWPGRPYPLGAAYDGGGTNFSLFSEVAEGVELCLFDEDGGEERLRLEEIDAFCLARLPAHRRTRAAVRLPGARTVGARARSAMQPGEAAARPYAKAIEGEVDWNQACFPYNVRRRGLAQRR